MKVLDIFSGTGGFSLGLESTGMETVAFCEKDKKCRLVLKKHWPDVPIYKDVRYLNEKRLREDGIGWPDVICGGFPCTDISVAGKQSGLSGEQSGLWKEFSRLISEIRPKYAIVENSSNLFSGQYGEWIRSIFGELAEIGYDAEGHLIPASVVGAPHLRDRAWILAYPNSERCGEEREYSERSKERVIFSGKILADSESEQRDRTMYPRGRGKRSTDNSALADSDILRRGQTSDKFISKGSQKKPRAQTFSNSDYNRSQSRISKTSREKEISKSKRLRSKTSDTDIINENDGRFGAGKISILKPSSIQKSEFWSIERRLGGSHDGLSSELDENLKDIWERGIPRTIKSEKGRVDRIKQLGNSVVPQLIEMIGKAIIKHEEAK